MSGKTLGSEESVSERLKGYDEPVLRATKSGSNIFHKPDIGSEELTTQCWYNEAKKYHVSERAAVEGFYEPCSLCFGGEGEDG